MFNLCCWVISGRKRTGKGGAPGCRHLHAKGKKLVEGIIIVNKAASMLQKPCHTAMYTHYQIEMRRIVAVNQLLPRHTAHVSTECLCRQRQKKALVLLIYQGLEVG